VNLLEVDTIEKSTEPLIDVSNEFGPEINIEETKYMLLSRHWYISENRYIRLANKSFGNVSQFKYLESTVSNKILVQEEIKRRFNSDNACHHSV
jgi:hypothetical protein